MTVENTIYQFKFLIRRISPMIWRRVLVQSHESLAHLHQVIQLSMGWDDDHLYCFKIHGKDFGSAGADTGDENEPMTALRLRPNQRFLYEYDYTTVQDIWEFDVRFEKSLPSKPGLHYPHCLDGRRSGPPDGCFGARDFVDKQYRFENQLIKDALEALKARHLDELREILEENNYYSRKILNQSFRQYFRHSSEKERRANEVQITIGPRSAKRRLVRYYGDCGNREE